MRVALVVDDLRWCFGHVARGIQKYAPPGYKCTVMDATEFNRYTLDHARLKSTFDAVCQFAWTEATHGLPVRNVTVLAHEGALYSRNDTSWLARVLTTQIRNREKAARVLPNFDAVLCFTERLCGAAGKRAVLCPPGVDTELFRPGTASTYFKQIGWCGQPVIQKGYPGVLHGIVNAVSGWVWRINCHTAETAVSQAGMAEWHRDNDLFLCTAVSEGGPLTVLEALASGVPVISTPVGIMPMLVDGVTMLPDRTAAYNGVVDAAVEAIRRVEFGEQSRIAARREAERWSWSRLSKVWLEAICA